jgi:hypothetical protein
MTDISMRNYDNRHYATVNNGNGSFVMDERGSWAIGGTTMMGIGVGFVFLPISPLLFMASVMMGIGAGLVLAAGLAERKE